jgi:hypothetical protein
MGVLELRFNDGVSPVAFIQGHVTKFEVPHSSKTAEVQLTIQCDDPIFKAPTKIQMTAADFPYAAPTMLIPNSISTAPHGLRMEFICKIANVASFQISDYTDATTLSDWMFKVTPGTINAVNNFQLNDRLVINSVQNKREIYLVRSSVTTYIADKVAPESVWPILFPGMNKFKLQNPSDFALDYIEYTPAFWGI